VQIAARHAVTTKKSAVKGGNLSFLLPNAAGSMVLDEVVEIIELPEYPSSRTNEDSSSIALDPFVIKELHDYVSTIAAMYRDNPFHNFEHVRNVPTRLRLSCLLARPLTY
jgi:hypothetical protein